MLKTRLNPKEIAYLKRNFGKKSCLNLAKAIGRSKATVKSFFSRNKMILDEKAISILRSKGNQTKTTSTPETDKFIRKNYLKLTRNEMARQLGRSTQFIKTRMSQLNLAIPPKVIADRIRNARFKKGNVPPNKGKRIEDYMSKEAIARSKETRFKKGSIPHNTKELGYERINADGYVEVRVKKGKMKNNFRLKQRIVYENYHNVKLKKNDLIIFKDRNKRNFDPNNLERISCTENLNRNTINRYPEEIREIIRLKSKLSRKLQKTT